MAMAGFDKEELQAPLAEINMTPLVDVMLVLLVIFLVTAPMLTQAVKLELPNETAVAIHDQKAVTLSIDVSGQYYWNNEPMTQEVLEERFQEAAANDPRQPIHLRADADVAYRHVSHVLAAAQRFGLSNVGFVTEPKQ